MQMALNDFQNVISFRLPKRKLWDFLQCTKFIVTNIIASQPITNAPTYFIDGNKKGIADCWPCYQREITHYLFFSTKS